MKFGIITFHKAKNYGAVLQTYALQHYLKSIGCNAEVIDYVTPLYDHYELNWSRNIAKNIALKIIRKNIVKSYKRFDLFIKNNISLTSETVNNSTLQDYISRTNFTDLITGSDQVWNPELVHNDEGYLLDINKCNIRKHSYAASIGLDNISKNTGDYYKQVLKTYKNISVREYGAKKILSKLGINNAEIVCDPTLLLKESEWNKVEKKVAVPSKYVLIFAFGYDTELIKAAKDYANSIHASLCIITNDVIPLKNAIPLSGLGPAEWLYSIHHAECIFTNSYHGLMFSIVFKKDFWVTDPGDGTNSRIEEILNVLGLRNRVLSVGKSVSGHINFNYHESKLQQLILSSQKYLQDIASGSQHSCCNQNEMFFSSQVPSPCHHVQFSSNCTGCSACFAICPKNAIDMVNSAKGFKYPSVNVDKCIECGKCVKTCPIYKDVPKKIEKKFYAFKNSNPEEVKKTSSGGIFILLAKKIINDGGVVYGVRYYGTQVKYGRATTEEELWKLSGTKYVESNKNSIFRDVLKDLKSGVTVLFSGTPCTIDGIKSYVGEKWCEKLITVDIICHGVPSPVIYNAYLSYLSKKFNSNIKSVDFRHKMYDTGINCYTKTKNMYITFDNGKVYEADESIDPYYLIYWLNVILRESCYTCKYARIDRVGDITIGDWWGKASDIEFFQEKTESSVIINSKKGDKLFNAIKDKAYILEVSQSDIMQRNLHIPTSKNSKMDKFWYDYFLKSFRFILLRYIEIPKLIRRVKNKF